MSVSHGVINKHVDLPVELFTQKAWDSVSNPWRQRGGSRSYGLGKA